MNMFGKVAIVLYDWLLSLLVDFSNYFAYFCLSLWPAKNSVFCGFLSYVCSNADRICKVGYLKVQKFLGSYFHVDSHDCLFIIDNPHQYSSWYSL